MTGVQTCALPIFYKEEPWRDRIRQIVKQHNEAPLLITGEFADEQACSKLCQGLLKLLVRPIEAELMMDAANKVWDDEDYPDNAMPRD